MFKSVTIAYILSLLYILFFLYMYVVNSYAFMRTHQLDCRYVPYNEQTRALLP